MMEQVEEASAHGRADLSRFKRQQLTDGVGLPVESGHHQRRPAQVRVRCVGLGSVAQQQGDALHVVGEGRGVKGGPAGGEARKTMEESKKPSWTAVHT